MLSLTTVFVLQDLLSLESNLLILSSRCAGDTWQCGRIVLHISPEIIMHCL